MTKAATVTLVSVLMILVGAPATSAARTQVQVNYDAVAFVRDLPSDDPCLVAGEVVVEALDMVPSGQSSLLLVNASFYPVCENRAGSSFSTNEHVPIAESAFHASSKGSGDLNVTVQTFDYFDNTWAPTTLSLHWTSSGLIQDGFASVTGTIVRGDTAVTLDDSIPWNVNGAAVPPWGALQFCKIVDRLPNSAPGC
jgi:hypothetical protein